MNIAFIGCGKLGMPCAEEIVKAGHSVSGYDPASIKRDGTFYNPHGLVDLKHSIAEAVKFAKIVFVAVPTPHDSSYDGRAPTAHLEPKDFSYDIVKDVLRECDRVMNPAQMIVLISTVLPGTVRRELEPIVTNTRFVYNPYLIAMGSVAWDFVNPEMVMIGTEDGDETGDAKELVNFYKTVIENDPRYVVGTWDECECIKVFYNTFISTKLGLANMIQDVAMKQGNINVDVVTDALAKSTKRIMGPQYMTAGMGDGGACHPRDNIALRWMAQELGLGYDIFDAIMNAREIQAKNLAEFLVAQAKEHDLPVLIHGEAYKPDVPYKDGSYSILVEHYCRELGYHPIMVDPHTSPQRGPFKAVVLLGHSNQVTYKYTEKETTQTFYCLFEEGSVIVDPWRLYRNEENKYKIIHYGNTRQVA
jgi:UDPglucose 6-dehydrogenase